MFEAILSSAALFLAYLYADPTAYMVTMVWVLIWKGLALWHAGTQKHKFWFVVLWIFNTLGILPILYLAFFSEKAFIKKINLPKVRRPKAKRPSRRATSSKSRRKR